MVANLAKLSSAFHSESRGTSHIMRDELLVVARHFFVKQQDNPVSLANLLLLPEGGVKDKHTREREVEKMIRKEIEEALSQEAEDARNRAVQRKFDKLFEKFSITERVVNATLPPDANASSPLHLAPNEEMRRLLLDEGADAAIKDGQGRAVPLALSMRRKYDHPTSVSYETHVTVSHVLFFLFCLLLSPLSFLGIFHLVATICVFGFENTPRFFSLNTFTTKFKRGLITLPFRCCMRPSEGHLG